MPIRSDNILNRAVMHAAFVVILLKPVPARVKSLVYSRRKYEYKSQSTIKASLHRCARQISSLHVHPAFNYISIYEILISVDVERAWLQS